MEAQRCVSTSNLTTTSPLHSMRLSSIQWLLCAASSAATAATAATAAAKVLVFDSNQSSPPGQAPPQQTVDPDTARLIFAQRLGLGQYHSIAGADEESIRHINAFSSQQQPLFAHEKHTEPISRFLVMVEGVDYDAEDEIKSKTAHHTQATAHHTDDRHSDDWQRLSIVLHRTRTTSCRRPRVVQDLHCGGP